MLLALVLLAAGLVLALAHRYQQAWLESRLSPVAGLLPAARRLQLVGQLAGRRLFELHAVLAGVFVPLVLLIHWLRRPYAGLGATCRAARLRGSGLGWWLGFAGLLFGLTSYLLVLLLLACFSFTPEVAARLNPGAPAWLLGVLYLANWMATVLGALPRIWPAALALMVVSLGYALSRVIVSHGAVQPLVERWLGPTTASLAAALVFAAAYRFVPTITPLQALNLALLGLVLDRLSRRLGTLWAGVGCLAGWVILGRLLLLGHQGAPGGEVSNDPFLFAPPLLSGAAAGPEGGLVASVVLAGWLTWLVLTPDPDLDPRLRDRPETHPDPEAEPEAELDDQPSRPSDASEASGSPASSTTSAPVAP